MIAAVDCASEKRQRISFAEIKVNNQIVAKLHAELILVALLVEDDRPRLSTQNIIATAADENVGAVAAKKIVVAVPAAQRILAKASDELVVTQIARHHIVSRAAKENVVAAATFQQIRLPR